jgi:hypothetical protein
MVCRLSTLWRSAKTEEGDKYVKKTQHEDEGHRKKHPGK